MALHDDQENIITVAVKPDLLQVIAQQLIVAAKQAEAGFAETTTYLPVVVEANKAGVVQEPSQGLFMIFEVNDGLSYIFPLGRQLATVLRDELTEALGSPAPDIALN